MAPCNHVFLQKGILPKRSLWTNPSPGIGYGNSIEGKRSEMISSIGRKKPSLLQRPTFLIRQKEVAKWERIELSRKRESVADSSV